MKRIRSERSAGWGCGALLILMLAAGNTIAHPPSHPVLAIDATYRKLHERNHVVPYYTTIYALDLLKRGEGFEPVRRYILWYASHMELSDRWGLSGTVYDYEITKDGRERPLKRYDSADGYAGLFLHLVALYYERTGDRVLVDRIWPSLKHMVSLLERLQGEEGLTRALGKPKYRTIYLMDNVESYLGFRAFAKLARGTGRSFARYEELARRVRYGIYSHLLDPRSGKLYWEKEGEKKERAGTGRFYPDIFVRIHLLGMMGSELPPPLYRKLADSVRRYLKNNAVTFGEEQQVIYRWAFGRSGVSPLEILRSRP